MTLFLPPAAVAWALIPTLVLTLAAAALGAEPPAFTVSTFPIIVVAERDDGRTINAMIDTYLDVAEEEHAQSVCAWMPRVRDAVSQVFSAHHLRAVDARIEFAGAGEKVKEAVNRALEAELITGVRLYYGRRTDDEKENDGTIVACAGGKAVARKAQGGKRRTGDVFDNKTRGQVKRRTGK